MGFHASGNDIGRARVAGVTTAVAPTVYPNDQRIVAGAGAVDVEVARQGAKMVIGAAKLTMPRT